MQEACQMGSYGRLLAPEVTLSKQARMADST